MTSETVGLVDTSVLVELDRKTSARAFDALIAATAVANGLPVYTSSSRDFEGVPGLQIHGVGALG